jgi:hypothetical protein
MIGISDSWNKPYDRKDPNNPEHGKIRKLSMTCQLTDGSEYEGGELEFDFRNYDPICEMNQNIEYNVKRYYLKVL